MAALDLFRTSPNQNEALPPQHRKILERQRAFCYLPSSNLPPTVLPPLIRPEASPHPDLAMFSRALRVVPRAAPRTLALRARASPAPFALAARSVTTNAASASLNHKVPEVRACAFSSATSTALSLRYIRWPVAQVRAVRELELTFFVL